MVTDVVSRHRGTLGGRFTDTRIPAHVVLEVSPEVAQTPTGQHLTWMLLNLLARQKDEIAAIELIMPRGVTPIAALGPLVPSKSGNLRECLLAGVESINPSVFGPAACVKTIVAIRIGPGPLGKGDLSLATTALSWSGYVGSKPADVISKDGNPIGAYIGACLAAAEVFKFVRGVRANAATAAKQLWLDGFNFAITAKPSATPELPPHSPVSPATVAGIGAVGNAFLHVLYALPDLQGQLTLIDGDAHGIDDTNLNRYVLFGSDDVNRQKASAAAELFAGRPIQVTPIDNSWQSWIIDQRNPTLELVVSAVDKNLARHAIQNSLPRLIIGASTFDMRAQVNSYNPLRGGLCLCCRNRIERPTGDDEVIAMLRQLGFEERQERARALGVDLEILGAFLADPAGHCGAISGTTLRKFVSADDQPEWSVGFVSALAGVLLAAEYLKVSFTDSKPILGTEFNTFRFQFWHPEKEVANRLVYTPPEKACVCQIDSFRRAYQTLWKA